jgi:hypothetical protein
VYEELTPSDNVVAGRPVWTGPARPPRLVYPEAAMRRVPDARAPRGVTGEARGYLSRLAGVPLGWAMRHWIVLTLLGLIVLLVHAGSG